MADLEGGIKYTFELDDEASDPATRAADALENLGEKADESKQKVDEAKESMNDATLSTIKTMSALQSMRSGLSALTGAMDQLQIGTEEMREGFKDAAAAIQLFVGAGQAITGTIETLKVLRSALKSTTIMSVMASVATNSLTGAAVIAGLGIAGGYALSQVNNNKNTAFVTTSQQETRQVQAIDTTGGWY